jgi:UDP-N-acetylglucosamine 2-epimerase (non-hydrolysing)
MPEEINRIVTDSLADYFFVTEQSGITNLVQEGKPEHRIHLVGNVMIDNLMYQAKKLGNDNGQHFSTFRLKQEKKDYVFLTLHRPSNVDSKECFEEIAAALNFISEERPILFPVHPRSQKMMDQFGIKFSDNVFLFPPVGFKEALFLWKDSAVVMTDSGGLQEETTALGVPCVTLRDNTERPITIEMGTNILAGTKKEGIIDAYKESLKRKGKGFSVPPKWDGRASERIWRVLLNHQNAPNDNI